MNKRIMAVILACLMVAGMVGTIVSGANDAAITLPDDQFNNETTPVTTAPIISGDDSDDNYAKGIVFKADTGVFADTYTGYVSGLQFNTTYDGFYAMLENSVGIGVRSEKTPMPARDDFILHGDKVVLYGSDRSVVEELTVIFMGNADANNAINISDASTMLKLIAGWDITADVVAADVNGDGVVNLSDVTLMLKKIAGWNVEFVKKPVLPGKYDMLAKGDVPCHGKNPTQGWVPLCLSDGIHYDLGVKFNVAKDEFATKLSFLCPSWSDNKGKLTVSVYKWTGDYNTSIAAMPIVSETFVDYEDNSTVVLDLLDNTGKGLVEGEYVWRMHDGADAGDGTGVGIWYFSEYGPAESTGMKTFLNCKEFNIGPVAYVFYATAINK